MGENKMEDIQQEWRNLILKKLESLESSQRVIEVDIAAMKINIALAAKESAYAQDQDKRIRELENFKERALTLFFVIQFLVGVGFMILNHFWK